MNNNATDGEISELYVTNFNPRFTGVSATAAAVISRQQRDLKLRLVGRPLPGAPKPITLRVACRLSKQAPSARPFAIWHVRRNSEMLAAVFARDVLRLPVRIVFTSAAQRRHSIFPRALIGRMDAVIATTSRAASFVKKVAAVVPHGVDVNRFTPAVDRAAAWAQTALPGRDGIGIVGRVRPEKGTDIFIKAMLEVLPTRPHAMAVVIGRWKESDSSFQRSLAGKVRAVGLERQVVFLGEVSADRMPGLMRSLAVLVAPPRYEGYGMTPLEAMASGVPVVASNTGAFAEMIEEGVTGHVVEVGEVKALSHAIAILMDDAAVRRHMGLLARERVVRWFSLDREAIGIANVYERLWRGERFT